MTTFRTASGQTGRDAYMFELAAIANAKRELDARADRLRAAMRAEFPSDWVAEHTFGSRARVVDAETVRRFLDFMPDGGTDTVVMETAEEIARTMRPENRS